MKFHEDDKAQRLIDLFPLKGGQVNAAYYNDTSVVTAWHKHEEQSDYIICLKGSFKVGLVELGQFHAKWTYLSDKNPRVLHIAPSVWHGWRALETGSILAYYMTEKYNPDDIAKVAPSSFYADWFPKDG